MDRPFQPKAGDRAGLVTDDHAVGLHGVGDDLRRRRDRQGVDVDARVEPEAQTLGDGAGAVHRPVGPVGGPRVHRLAGLHEGDRQRVVDVAGLQLLRGDDAARQREAGGSRAVREAVAALAGRDVRQLAAPARLEDAVAGPARLPHLPQRVRGGLADHELVVGAGRRLRPGRERHRRELGLQTGVEVALVLAVPDADALRRRAR